MITETINNVRFSYRFIREDEIGRTHWIVTIVHERRKYSTPFIMGKAMKGCPSFKDVMYCILTDALSYANHTDIDTFARVFFDNTSKPSEIIQRYRSCRKAFKALQRLFTPDQLDNLWETFKDY